MQSAVRRACRAMLAGTAARGENLHESIDMALCGFIGAEQLASEGR